MARLLAVYDRIMATLLPGRSRVLLGPILLCFALLSLRIGHAHRYTYLFLVWNLFLAWIPLVASYALANRPKHWFVGLSWFGIWLIFFPNAPYIITDLFHLHHRPPTPLWLDLLVLCSFAFTGLFMAFISLYKIHGFMARTFNSWFSKLTIGTIILMSGFGVYVGRYLRWNSWDLLLRPFSLIQELLIIIFHPLRNFNAWSMSICFGLFLLVFYFSFYRIVKRD